MKFQFYVVAGKPRRHLHTMIDIIDSIGASVSIDHISLPDLMKRVNGHLNPAGQNVFIAEAGGKQLRNIQQLTEFISANALWPQE